MDCVEKMRVLFTYMMVSETTVTFPPQSTFSLSLMGILKYAQFEYYANPDSFFPIVNYLRELFVLNTYFFNCATQTISDNLRCNQMFHSPEKQGNVGK